MIAYFDTSALIPLLVQEPGTEQCGQLWRTGERVVTVRLAYAEARSALAQAARTGRISRLQHQTLATGVGDLLAQADLVDVDEELVLRAGQLAESYALRAYDAVHLAAALTVAGDDLVLIAGDRALLAAARTAGLATAAVG